jgi:hypothetical protein
MRRANLGDGLHQYFVHWAGKSLREIDHVYRDVKNQPLVLHKPDAVETGLVSHSVASSSICD